MPLTTGTRLGAFTIEAPIGAGGMGEVYRARDTRLDRTVAIKVLPPQLSSDPEFRERFAREAKSISQLSHPNICTLHDIGQSPAQAAGSDTLHFLILEYLQGETLADRLARGPIPVARALKIGSEIAAALDSAHRHGIVHRDLKPGNIFLSAHGASPARSRHSDENTTVKLLDFGLAKADGPRGLSGAAATAAVTAAAPLTARGTVMGTLLYMAPEQVEGEEADARTDIFAFGAVLFEMVAGRKAFSGKSEASLLGAIVSDEPPPVSTLATDVPPALDYLIRTCLAKNPDARFQTAHDVGLQLRWIAEGSGSVAPVARTPSGFPQSRWVWAAATATLAILAAAAARWLKPVPTPPRSVARFSFSLPEGQTFTNANRRVVAIAPDGARFAYVANRQLYVRDLDRLESQSVRGTEELSGPAEPLFSPDGQWLAYFVAETAGGGGDQSWIIKKVALTGGVPTVIGRLSRAPLGATWGPGGIVVGQGAAGIERVSDTGGSSGRIAAVADSERAVQPQVLDDGRHVVFAVPTPLNTGRETASGEGPIVVQSLAGGPRKVLVNTGANPRVLPSGHLVYVQDRSIVAAPFDPRRLDVTGPATVLVQNVTVSPQSSAGQFAISRTGSLVYVSGSFSNPRSLVWTNRRGGEEAISAPPSAYQQPRISPDGTRLVVSAAANVWIWNFDAETLMRLTNEAATQYNPAWTPDGRQVVYDSNDGSGAAILRRAADGTGTAETLAQAPAGYPEIVLPDGKSLIYHPVERIAMLLPINPKGAARPLLPETKGQVSDVELSPDRRWIAYESNESGRFEVYVRPFPDVNGGRWQLSSNGGLHPLWSRSGRELFFIAHDGTLTAVRIKPGPSFAYEKPAGLFPAGHYYVNIARNFDVAPDGTRFLFIKSASPAARPSIAVVTNWIEELRARVGQNARRFP